jgi:ribosomal protein L32
MTTKPDGDTVTKLLALFDAAFAIPHAELVLFEEDTPGAEYAARLWASPKKLEARISRNDVTGDPPFEVVRIDRNRHQNLISIHRVECGNCGEFHNPERCPWLETCSECSRTDAAMAKDRLCLDCEESQERSAEIDRREAAREGHPW